MDRKSFIANADVADFIEWLVKRARTLPVRFSILASHRARANTDAVTGLEEVLKNYDWVARWTDLKNNVVHSRDWASTHRSIALMSETAKAALKAKNSETFKRAACEILIWGGVPSSKAFLDRMHDDNNLIAYFDSACSTLNLATADVDKAWPSIEQFNAGLTKIHAMLSNDGLPIFDSRVGAAIGGLVALFQISRGQSEPSGLLRFPSGSARGRQLRNAGDVWAADMRQNQFYTASVSAEYWAKASVRLGWLIEEVLTRDATLFVSTDFFESGLPSLQQRMHAFEAALFMVGYDLRCLSDRQDRAFVSKVKMKTTEAKTKTTEAKVKTTRVQVQATKAQVDTFTEEVTPIKMSWRAEIRTCAAVTKFPFITVLPWYAEFRLTHPNNRVLSDFARWIVDYKTSTKNNPFEISTARAYCYPLKESELNIAELSDERLMQLVQKPLGDDALSWLMNFAESDLEEMPNCVIAIFMVGTLFQAGLLSIEQRVDELVATKRMNSPNSAKVFEYTGRTIGKYFGLFEDSGGSKNTTCKPTERFFNVFSKG